MTTESKLQNSCLPASEEIIRKIGEACSACRELLSAKAVLQEHLLALGRFRCRRLQSPDSQGITKAVVYLLWNIVKLEPAASRYLSFSGFASQMSKYDYPTIEKRIEACTYQAPDLPHCRNTTGRLQKAPYRGRAEHSSSCRGAIVRLEDSVGLAVRNYCRQLSTLSRPEVYTAWCGPCLSIAAATDIVWHADPHLLF